MLATSSESFVEDGEGTKKPQKEFEIEMDVGKLSVRDWKALCGVLVGGVGA
jgi:hypothetical protein